MVYIYFLLIYNFPVKGTINNAYFVNWILTQELLRTKKRHCKIKGLSNINLIPAEVVTYICVFSALEIPKSPKSNMEKQVRTQS